MIWKIFLLRVLFIYTLGILIEVPVYAERPVTLEEAYRSADIGSDQIHLSRENLVQSELEIRRARSFIFPQLSSTLSYLRRPQAFNSGVGVILPESEKRFNLTLEQPLFSGGRATATYDIAKKGAEGSRLDLSLTRENLLFNVAQAYYAALKAQKNVVIEENEVKRLEAHRNDSEKRVRVGEATKTVLLRADAELSGSRARLIRASSDFATSLDQLAFFAKIDGPFELVDPPQVSIGERTEREWIDTARENRTDMRRRSVQIDIARKGIDFARGNFYPSLSLEGQYNWDDQSPASPFIVRNDRFAMIKMTVPIFEGGLRSAELSQAKSRLRQSEIDKALFTDQLDVEVRSALLNLAGLTSQLAYLKDQVAFARDNFSLVSRQFAVGLATPIDVLDANATLLDSERLLSNTVYDREVAILAVKKTVGVFLIPAAQAGN